MTPLENKRVPIASEEDIVHARRIVRTYAQELGIGLTNQTKLVTAVSELARNTYVHGGGGTMQIELVSNPNNRGIRLVFEDQGPGIPNIDLAMQDGYSTGNGLGLGLGGAKRLVHEFEIVSVVGQGTRVTITMWV
ncbi:MAG: anti-sigma regulatory factor [Anaerolineae bacterium]|nr:anti-sigma regulatory factor [Anaerolineae bacterium]